jgi:hypothetical protein
MKLYIYVCITIIGSILLTILYIYVCITIIGSIPLLVEYNLYIYVCITIIGSIPLLVEYKLYIYVCITIIGSIPLLVEYKFVWLSSASVIIVSTLTWSIRYIYFWNLQFLNNIITCIIKTKILGLFWLCCLSPLVYLLPNFLITWLSNLRT